MYASKRRDRERLSSSPQRRLLEPPRLPRLPPSQASASAAVDMLLALALRLAGVVLDYSPKHATAHQVMRGRFVAAEDGSYALNVMHRRYTSASGLVTVHE